MAKDSVRHFWNKAFEKSDTNPPSSTGSEELDQIIEEQRHKDQKILDFGCGSGKTLYLFANGMDGTHHGIDLSPVAIEKARTLFKNAVGGDHDFQVGGAYLLRTMKSSYYDTILLFNILDNLEEEDAGLVLRESQRLLISGGRMLGKLNPHLDEKTMRDYGMQMVSRDLYLEENGIYLLNKSDAYWESVLSENFDILDKTTLHYPEHGQTNRFFMVRKP